jgi:hypothetical protein
MIAGLDRTTLMIAAAALLAAIGTLVPDLGLAVAVIALGILGVSTLLERYAPTGRREG